MRQIVKGLEPDELRRWKEQNANVPQNLKYGSLHGPVKRAIRQQMLGEQGFLCAYTMQQIQDVDDCHLEHIVPQNQPPTSDERDLDYSNMLACFPGNQPDPDKPTRDWNPQKPYGARHKDKIEITAHNFISPLSEDVERRFRYDAGGFVNSDTGDTAAASTIRILNLDHGVLNDLRRAAIEERLFASPLSAGDAEAMAVSIEVPNAAGLLPEFCVAISQASIWYAKVIRQNSGPASSV